MAVRRAASFAVVAVVAAVTAACGAAPPTPVERALYLDMKKVVETHESTDWIVDRIEIENAAPAAMRSTCQVEPAARANLLAWLDSQIAAMGGPAAAAYRRAGHDKGAVTEILRLERIRALVQYSDAHAEDCPFWLEPDSEFAGVQGDADRFVIIAESAGGAGLFVRGSNVALGGSGGIRVMPGWGITDRLTLALGVEASGSAALPEGDDPGTTQLRATYALGVPLLLRFFDSSRVWDFEVTGSSRISTHGVQLPGVRGAIGYGLTTLRVGDIMPFAVVWAGYEYQPPSEGGPAEHIIRLGTRVGVDWDP